MPKIKQTTVYEYDELSESAQEKAREWYQSMNLDYEWWDCTYDDAKTIGLKITGFELDRNKHVKGQFMADAIVCAQLITANHGETSDTYQLAIKFIADRSSLIADLTDKDGELEDTVAYDNLCREFERALLIEYASLLQNEYDWLTGEQHAGEMLKANGYEFLKNGEPA